MLMMNSLLQVCIAILTCCLLVAQRTSGLRIPKEEARPKPKCHTNVTQSKKDSNPSSLWVPKCIALNHPYCLDVRLPYNSTTLPEYIPEIKTFDEISSYLERWQGVKTLPRCWPVLQMALCSILMPQCDEDPSTGKISRYYRPNVDICHDLVYKDECKFLGRQFEDWPSLFNCDDSNIFAKNCTNQLRSIKFTATAGKSQCQYPLVPDDDEATWFNEISGCAMNCKFPVSNIDEQVSIALFRKILSGWCFVATISAIILFTANEPSSERKSYRMAKVIRHCTWCHLLEYIGWSLPMVLDVDIGCGRSGSTLYGLSLVANSCVLSFLLTYPPSLCSLFWSAYLGKLCHEELLGRGERSKGTTAVDNLASLFIYGFSLVMTACVVFLGYIDGRALYGVCTVGQQSVVNKTVFIFAPKLIGTVYDLYFFIPIIIKLWSRRDEAAMRPILVWFTALALLTVFQPFFEISNYFYEYRNYERWRESVNKYVGCQLNLQNIDLNVSLQESWNSGSNRSKCSLESKTMIILDYMELLTTLSRGLVIASWSFNKANYHGLKRKLIDMLLDEQERQKIDRSVINPELELFNGRAKFLQEDVELATYRDLFDMTWCDEDQDNRRAPEMCRRAPSSLGSTALPIDLDSEDSSMLNQNIGHDVRSKPHDSYKAKRRDIERDITQRKLARQQQSSAQTIPAPQIASDAITFMLMKQIEQAMQGFNPPPLSVLQPPSFNQGFSGNVPAQERPSVSGVQQEESKT